MQCLLLKNNTSPHVLKVRVTSVDKWTNSGEIRKQVFSPTARNDEKQKLEIQIDGTATEGLVHTGAEVTNFTKILASRFAPSGGKYSFVCLFFWFFKTDKQTNQPVPTHNKEKPACSLYSLYGFFFPPLCTLCITLIISKFPFNF